jgi:hypothetical protein
MEDLLCLDTMPQDLKAIKKSTTGSVNKYLRSRLQHHQEADPPTNEIRMLREMANKHAMDYRQSVTGVVISAIKLFTFRFKKSRMPLAADVEDVERKLGDVLREHGGTVEDVGSQFAKLRELVQPEAVAELVEPTAAAAEAEPTSLPMVLITDSMFSKLKASDDLLPIAHSGERMEELAHWIPFVQVRARAIVVNHGLNHTNHFGDLQSAGEVVFETLQNQAPGNVYHLQPPVSPSISRNPAQQQMIARFGAPMMGVGFTPIDHPTLLSTDFAGDEFHYSHVGMNKMAAYVMEYVDGR